MKVPTLVALGCVSMVGGALGQVPVSGSFAPEGPPIGEVVRADAGDACVVDLIQRYTTEGDLVGRLEIDYRIFVDGPCGSPQGTFQEHWIAKGSFEGAVDGHETAATFWYRAEVAVGGIVEGTLGLSGGLHGELSVTGRFSDGRLSYRGVLRPS